VASTLGHSFERRLGVFSESTDSGCWRLGAVGSQALTTGLVLARASACGATRARGDWSLSGGPANGVGQKLVGNHWKNSYEVWKFSRIAHLEPPQIEKGFRGALMTSAPSLARFSSRARVLLLRTAPLLETSAGSRPGTSTIVVCRNQERGLDRPSMPSD
jgi:hypothetical protein